MLPTIASVAAAIDSELDGARRRELEQLAIGLLELQITQRHVTEMSLVICRLKQLLDRREEGGDDDRRDGAAA